MQKLLLHGALQSLFPYAGGKAQVAPRVIASNFTTGIKSTVCHIEIILVHERKSLINLAS
jgi:hypothetical protein